jgi:succinate-semialdehyde dehydrogenase/glutarate-semialdehyde dehydrogenase
MINGQLRNAYGIVGSKIRNIHTIKNKHLLNFKGYINGEWTDGYSNGKTFDVYNPCNGEVIATLPSMNIQDVEYTCKIANDAFNQWKMTTVTERERVLKKMATLMDTYNDDLAKIITLESGKPFIEVGS